MSTWKLLLIGAGVGFLVFYAYAVRRYLRGVGREGLENGVKALLTIKKNGGVLEVWSRGRGVVLCIFRHAGQENWAVLHLRVPLTKWSFLFGTEIQESLGHHGYEVVTREGSPDCIAEVRIPVEDIWAAGSASRGAEAANLVLDELGYGKDARFNLRLRGRMDFRLIMSRPRNP